MNDVSFRLSAAMGGDKMKIHDYHTAAGKNLIKEYLSKLPKSQKYIGYRIRHKLGSNGLSALEELDTRQLLGKLWEIKFSQNRFMFVIADNDNIHILHVCKMQKGKAEQFELDKAIQRAKEKGFNV